MRGSGRPHKHDGAGSGLRRVVRDAPGAACLPRRAARGSAGCTARPCGCRPGTRVGMAGPPHSGRDAIFGYRTAPRPLPAAMVTAFLSLFVFLTLALLVMRVGAAALALTGVSSEVARFQAQSAFLGVGYTTRESEAMMGHPVRRRIVTALMFVGNAGIITGVSTVLLVLSAGSGPSSGVGRVLALAGALAVFFGIARSRTVDRQLTRLVEWGLRRWTHLDTKDYVSLLRLAGDFSVIELEVQPTSWLADRTLAELDLRSEGVLVLGIERAGNRYIGVPRGPTRILPQDRLIVYGRGARLAALDGRRAGLDGDRAHAIAVEEHHAALGLPTPSEHERVRAVT